MTEDGFWMLTGYWPVNDDLDRANCSQAGEVGHHDCGCCDVCGIPFFLHRGLAANVCAQYNFYCEHWRFVLHTQPAHRSWPFKE